jgi:hypothetical protein
MLLETGDARTRCLIAEAGLASPSAQIRLASDPSKVVRLALAKVTSQEMVLRAFRMDDDPSILKALLANKKTPNDLRCRIIQEAPAEVQEVLCDASNYLALPFYSACKRHLTAQTRAGISRRAGLQAGILLELSHDADTSVRLAVAQGLSAKAHTHSRN